MSEELGIQIERTHALPELVAAEIEAVIVRDGVAAAIAAIADADVVAQLLAAVEADKSSVHLRMAGAFRKRLTEGGQFAAFGFRHDQTIQRQSAGLACVIDLQKEIRILRKLAVDENRRGPRPSVSSRVARFQAKLDDGVVRLRREDGSVNSVAGLSIAGKPIVAHRDLGVSEWPIDPIAESDGNAFRLLIQNPRRDRDGFQ